ncbi:MAG: hypothetical protein R8M70_01295 [Alphaproteobacteria bacterium]|nr:hypothetical protein [Alphaproteobacteria bacterium]
MPRMIIGYYPVKEVMALGAKYWEDMVCVAECLRMPVDPSVKRVIEDLKRGREITLGQANKMFKFRETTGL